MALRLSTGLRQALVTTDDFKALMDGGWLDIFTGAQPANANAVETGTKLVRISSTSGTAASVGCKFGTASSGVLPIGTPAWTGIVLVAGVAGWARFYSSAGTPGTSNTELRMDMNCGVSGADLVLTHTSLDLDSVVTVKSLNIEQPAE